MVYPDFGHIENCVVEDETCALDRMKFVVLHCGAG